MYYFTIAILLAATLYSFVAKSEITINQSIDDSVVPEITLRSIYDDFQRDLSLKLNSHPDMTVDDLLRRQVLGYGIADREGTVVQEQGLDIDKTSDVILGYSQGQAEILDTHRFDDGRVEVTGSFKKDGKFIAPSFKHLTLNNLHTGEKLCLDQTVISPPLSITLLIDISGSMATMLDDVKEMSRHFLKSLPEDRTQCAVGFFNHDFTFDKIYQSCQSNAPFGFKFIAAHGGTDIYRALTDTYQHLATDTFKQTNNIVVILTDGYVLDDNWRKLELSHLKQQAKAFTFVYLFGGDKGDALEGITDSFLPNNGDIKEGLAQYFKVLSEGYAKQKTVITKACPVAHGTAQGKAHAKP